MQSKSPIRESPAGRDGADPAAPRLVLVGAGHAHVAVLRSFAMRRPPEAIVTLVSPHSYATYSGMVPGYLAGQYRLRDAQIDARALAARAGAAFLPARVTAVDKARRMLSFDSYPDLPYDVVSFDVGSRPAHGDRIGDHPATVLVKPIEIAARDLGADLDAAEGGGARSVVVVGAGPGGVELAFAIAARAAGRDGGSVTVCDRAARPVTERGERTVAAVERAFAARGIRFVGGAEVEAVDATGVRLAGGVTLAADLVVWATGAAAPRLFAGSGLAVDERGFLSVGDDLRCIDDDAVFAAGDCATMVNHPDLAKAGVYAVRQGPVLAENLRAAVAGGRLRRYRPQSGFLSLLNSGDGKAILSYRGFAYHGRFAWMLKDFIDRRFVRRYARPRLAPPDPAMAPMIACGGCAAKVGADVLERVLARLDVRAAAHVEIGLAEADDAAAFRPPATTAAAASSVVTADLFPPFADDLYLVGRVAAVNAASDLYAMGAEGAAAVALVAVPGQRPRDQEAALEALLRGAAAALDEMGIPLVGGHTIVAEQPLIGFSMHGFAASGELLRKSGAVAGEALVLSKPLGTGVLLAAARAGVADSDWVEACHRSMLRSNGPAMRLLRAHGASACTDVTGFGLLGHLSDLARRSGGGAEIDRAAVPALPGAAELLAHGWRSSFHAGNERVHGGAAEPLLVDPQTSGGLLAAVPDRRLADLLAAASAAGEPMWVIGRIVNAPPGHVEVA